MAQTIVQENYTLNIATRDFEQAAAPAASPLANTPGMRWKIWFLNETEREAGGIYLFDDEASARAFVDGMLAAVLNGSPAYSNARVKQFGVMEEPTAITRGPVHEGTHV